MGGILEVLAHLFLKAIYNECIEIRRQENLFSITQTILRVCLSPENAISKLHSVSPFDGLRILLF